MCDGITRVPETTNETEYRVEKDAIPGLLVR
jgi:hypothetical protein